MSLATKVVLASVVLDFTMPVMASSWAKGGTMCGAGESNLDHGPSFSLCDCGTATLCSTSYIKSTVLGLGLCTGRTWATCYKVEDQMKNTRQEYTKAVVSSTGTYVVMSDGIGVGGLTAGGFVGTASSLVTSGTISYNEVDFLTSDAAGTASVARLCIIPSETTTKVAHTTCGPKRTETPGTFKFSLYGITWGSDYHNVVTSQGSKWVAFRTRVCSHGMTELKVNNVADGAGIVGKDTKVTSISVTQADGTVLSYTFPTNYMFGSKSGCEPQGKKNWGPDNKELDYFNCKPTGTKEVYITVALEDAATKCGGSGLYIDYAFDMDNLNEADKWFAYDPDVTTSKVQANQVCSASIYNTHALCNATDPTKELVYDTTKASTTCVAATCTVADCCRVVVAPVTAVWSASAATATLLANKVTVPGNILKAAGAAKAGLLKNLNIADLTCEASGPSAAGTIKLTMDSSTAALADSQFPRWIAKGIAHTMGCDESQVDVTLQAGTRRLSTDAAGRRLTSTVPGTFNVYNPNRGRNIGLGVGLGLVAPALGLGLGLGEGLSRNKATSTPSTEAPVTAAPVPVTTTAAPEEGSSMPLWAGILLSLAVLACIGAAVFFGTQQKEKKKKSVRKAAPVAEEVKVVEEVVPMLPPVLTAQPAPVIQTYQPAPVVQSVQYVQQAPPVTYAAPAYTSITRGF